MILTLAWKELREHQAILLTMVFMTVVLGFGMTRIIAPGNEVNPELIGSLTVLGMAATYGVVCGSMMFAGEHEGGTLVFLDIFLGRRGLLWLGKFAIGAVLVLAESVAVALLLRLMNQVPPAWVLVLAGHPAAIGVANQAPSPMGLDTWLVVLPVVTLEAYAWGLLGSSLTRRVLPGAAVAVVAAAHIWLIFMSAPPQVSFTLRLAAVVIILAASCLLFFNQSREAAQALPRPEEQPDPQRRFLDLWEAFERRERLPPKSSVPAPTVMEAPAAHGQPPPALPAPSRRRLETQASSPGEVLWWLTFQQALGFFSILAAAAFFIGFLIPSHGQLLWPFATLLIGVACGTAAFAPEQRDLSYQFLAAQHFPLQTIWRFKILFWFTAAVVAALILVLGGFLFALGRILVRLGLAAPGVNAGFHMGTLRELMGPVLFYGVWLVYGFVTGQVFVWLCRKNILAVLLSGLVSGAALCLWLPSLLCRGMNGWQLWVPPSIMLLATWLLARAWAGGRIKERKPLAALIGFTAAAAAWALLNFGYRAWEIPDVNEPLDPVAFRASLPSGQANVAGKKIQEALAFRDQPDIKWLARMEEVARLPLGVIEMPRADGQSPLLQLLPGCRKMTLELLGMAQKAAPGTALEHLAQILALSRNLRNKASLESYRAGAETEAMALQGLDLWMARGTPAPELLRRALDELNRHAAETPPPLDCLKTECFRSGGMRDNPSLWTFYSSDPKLAGRVPERWLAGSIALSLNSPWEAERKTRLWRLVWAGLFRAVETPHWQLPEPAADLHTENEATQQILRGWLAASEGPSAGVTSARLARLVDASWLADERLFCSVTRLRAAATRSRWRVDASRQAAALWLYQIQEGKPAQNLDDLVPKYLAELPTDPYSGRTFRYRISPGEIINGVGAVRVGQAILWSTGPDRIDHGGTRHGLRLPEDDPLWGQGGFDLITVVP